MQTENNQTKNNQTKNDQTENNQTKNDQTENNQTKNDPTENNQTKNNQTKNNQTKNDQTENNQTKNDQTKNNQTKNNPTKNNQTENNQTENNKTENNQPENNKSENSKADNNPTDTTQPGKCIIICAGEFTPVQIQKSEEDLLIAADNGYANCQMVGLFPDIVVGDFDSATESVKQEITALEKEASERVIRLPSEKDDTDTLAAIRIGLEKGYRKFFFYGALGGRLDHTLANIQCLELLKKQGAKGYIMDLHTMVTLIRDEEISFHPAMRGTLSVFCMGDKAIGVNISHMKYNLEQSVLTNSFPIGISNEFLGNEKGTISVEHGSLLLVISWED